MDESLKFVYTMILFLSLFFVAMNVKSLDCHSDHECYNQLSCIIEEICLDGSCHCPPIL
ncbi:putative Late nodulin [Medicago truncatula]|uniref:Nodule Cysteine-Rich (NCR) secreted peptide n=1 Tax=Medicago truncatula TaxID=3880 RepID=A0A072TRV3_MEDTR|nr:Nodule Cysteine-Rich (NCR) secreted peptide [Medicago truncatula]RHN41602.1 putative Late nodulin [Medicago truncatula]